MKNEAILTASNNMQKEYCCTVVKIGDLTPIPNSDFLASTLVNGLSIVVRKDEVKKGDIMLYAAIECQLNPDYLSACNLFEMSERTRNRNYKEVQALIDSGNEEFAKRLCGFFTKQCRVKLIRLRKCPSFGFLFTYESLKNWKPKLPDIDLEKLVGTDFDTVDGDLFVKVFIPKTQETKNKEPKKNKRGLRKLSRMVEGEFTKHYESDQLAKEIDRISPNDTVTISVKLHGTSAIFGNIKCRVLKKANTGWPTLNRLIDWIHVGLPKKWQKIEIRYANVYSSRNVILNEYDNFSVKKLEDSFLKTDVWKYFNDIIKDYIPEGMLLYGEIIGYKPDNPGVCIQTDYDYKCDPGKCKLMIYRINTKSPKAEIGYEWNVSEVYEWTMKLIKEHPNLEEWIHPIDILYHGKLTSFYPDIPVGDSWHADVLEAMKVEKRFGMEQFEPLCKNKVIREGIVLRIDNDPIKEAFKLKSLTFLEKEQKRVDAGEVDMEMEQQL